MHGSVRRVGLSPNNLFRLVNRGGHHYSVVGTIVSSTDMTGSRQLYANNQGCTCQYQKTATGAGNQFNWD